MKDRIELTPEQEAKIREAQRAGRHDVELDFTPEQDAKWDEVCTQAEREKSQVVERVKRRKAATAEETVSGRLRRAIDASGRSFAELERATGITALEFDEFMCGERLLDSAAVDRLAAALDLQLVAIRR